MVVLRKHADSVAEFEVNFTYILAGKKVKDAGLIKMPVGMKIAGYVRELNLPFGSTVVEMNVVPPGGVDSNADNNRHSIIVNVSK
jgi:hypothetical protein